MLYNDGYAQLCGKRHPASLGAPMAEVWYDIWNVVGDLVRRVYAGESIHMDDIELLMHRNGFPEEAHFSFSYNPLRNEQGDVIGLFCACAEITQEVFLKRDLAHERALLRQMFEQAPSFIAKLDGPDHTFEFVNPSFVRLVGDRDIIGKPIRTAFPDAQGQGYFEMLDSVLTTGKAVTSKASPLLLQKVRDHPMEERFVDFVYQPVCNTAGSVTGVFVEGVDVTDSVRAMTALQISEQFLRSVLKASPDCVKVLDLEGRVEYINDNGRLLLEVPDGKKLDGSNWTDFWADIDAHEVMKSVELAKKGQPSGFQVYSDTFAGNRRYWDVRVTPMLNSQGQPERILAVSRDLTYLKQIEEDREHLMQELSHRLNNSFTLVSSVINQTLRKATSVDAARETLTGRVRALAGAQSILTKSVTDKMDIHEVVEAALLPHRTGEGRFVINGPMVNINGKQGLGLSLALHELATNATKYGALSDSHGQVTIDWGIGPNGQFYFNWQESGGPAVSPPQHSGFGSILIEKIVSTYFDGTAKLHYASDGVVLNLTGTIEVLDNTQSPDPY